MQEETDSVPEPGPRAPAVRLFAPGTEVGTRYEIRAVLGTGGSASVYAAWDRDLRRLVALKALRHDRMSETALKRFRREVAVARDADSPRLVRVYDIGEAGETVFLTMELVEGGSLRDRLATGPLGTGDALRIGKEILRALGDLHRLGIVHRDVKPGNVLLAAGGGVKLADFGLARHWEGGDTRATETEGIVGTMEYLAPEQALGKTVDARTDVYAFGVVLYEMLAGNVPFVSDSALGGVVARLREPAPDLRKTRADAPAWLAAVVAKSLEKEPGNRYATAGEMLADLEAERAPGGRWRGALPVRPSALAGVSVLAGAGALAVAVALLAAGLGARRWSWPGAGSVPPRLLTDGARGLRAVDASGRVLWSRADVQGAVSAALVRTKKDGSIRIAAVLENPDGSPAMHSQGTSSLAFLDPRNGKLLESHRLPSGAGFLSGFSDTYRTAQVVAVDLAGDGNDAVVVVFTHDPYYPSYAVLFEPSSGSSRLLLAHSGHSRLRGAFDLDGDGRRELIFEGPNNRMGWLTGTAAIRVPPAPLPGGGSVDAALPGPVVSPDLVRSQANPANLLWYVLGPSAVNRPGDPIAFDPASRLLTIRARDVTRVLTSLGFAAGQESRHSPAERQESRSRSYAFLRDATQGEETGFFVEALRSARRAVEEARAAEDPHLLEWARRVSGRIAILGGRPDEGEKELSPLLESSEEAADVAFEMARAFHLAGDPGRSVRWYSWGLSRVRSKKESGRAPYEFLEGELFALAEAERWRDADEAIARFDAAFPGSVYPALCGSFLQIRRGRPPSTPPVEATGGEDLGKYWTLELKLAAGEALDVLDREIAAAEREASETRPLLRSLSAEVEARRGNLAAALERAAAAWSEVRAARLRHTWARAHAPIVAERLARIAEKAGRPDVAREARTADRPGVGALRPLPRAPLELLR